jgi:hypothetical protein
MFYFFQEGQSMKSLLCIFSLAMILMAGCGKSKKAGVPVKFEGVSVTSIAGGAKTKSGKPVDAYEVKSPSGLALFLIVGGGSKLENSGSFLTLDGNEFLVENNMMKNSVLVVDKKSPAPLLMPDVLPGDAKAKCAAGGIIDLPIDDVLARPRPGRPTP